VVVVHRVAHPVDHQNALPVVLVDIVVRQADPEMPLARDSEAKRVPRAPIAKNTKAIQTVIFQSPGNINRAITVVSQKPRIPRGSRHAKTINKHLVTGG
jgi:hypothetical protein